MYNFLCGKIEYVGYSGIVIEISGIGYEVKVPNPFYYHVGTDAKVHTYLHVREDIFELYGFNSRDEKTLFIKLLSVKGIGPKSALAVLASGSVSEIQNAIERSDDKYLTKFPGIGPKAAMQIVLDLKGKVYFTNEKLMESNYLDVIEALVSLGYKKKEIDKVISKVPKGLSDSDAIKETLKLL